MVNDGLRIYRNTSVENVTCDTGAFHRPILSHTLEHFSMQLFSILAIRNTDTWTDNAPADLVASWIRICGRLLVYDLLIPES